MIKHGISHATASLVIYLSGDLLAKEIYRIVPHVKKYVMQAGELFARNFYADYDANAFASSIVVILLGALWGIAFHISQEER